MTTRDQVYTKFGETAEATQLFETSLGTLLLGMKGLEEGWRIQPDPSSAAGFLDSIQKETLGSLLKRLATYDGLNRDLLLLFTDALKSRNALIHGFFERHNFRIQTESGRSIMHADLEEIHNRVFAAWQIADSISATVLATLLNSDQQV